MAGAKMEAPNVYPISKWYTRYCPESDLGLRLDLRGAATDTLGLRALQVRSRDPALIVLRAASDSRAISTNNSDLLSGVDLLRSLRGLLGALATLAAALLLGEEGSDPGVVDEVDGTSESAKEDEVKEDATNVH